MPQQRRFEGTTLAEVLAKVQKEIGTHAKIESAQKVRAGGVGGFFQRERYEVIVNVDESAPAHADHAAQPTSLLELAEQMNEVETKGSAPQAAAPAPAPPPPPAPPKAPPVTAKPSPTTPPETAQKPPAPKATPSSTPIKPERPETTVSTESDAFAEILSRVAFQANMTSETEPKALSPEKRAEALPPPPRKDPVPPPPPPIIDAPSSKPVPAEQSRSIPGRPVALGTVPEKSLLPEKAMSPVRTRVTDSPLALLGLPAQYIPEIEKRSETFRALEAALERLPEPPIVRPGKGSIVAVVGGRRDALKKAVALAEHWGRPAEEVVLATQAKLDGDSPNIVRTVQSAEDCRRSWSRRNQPTVVAVDATPGSRSDAKWAEHILTAMEPVATYGVVDATRKAEDIASWTGQLGGIDCLSVNNIEHTVSPASAIAVGIPIDRIDGRDATPTYWAMLLTERMGVA